MEMVLHQVNTILHLFRYLYFIIQDELLFFY